MAKLRGEELLQKLNWRYAVKKFDPAKKLSAAEWKVLEDVLILTPTSYGLQPYKFLVIQDPKLRAQLRAVSWNQSQVEEASHFVVFLARETMDEAYITKFIARNAEVRNTSPDKFQGYKELMLKNLVQNNSKDIPEWSARQAYIALGNLMTAAATLDIDTCPLEGLDPVKYDEILGLKGSGYYTLAACAVGHRHAEDAYAQATKVRWERKDLIEFR